METPGKSASTPGSISLRDISLEELRAGVEKHRQIADRYRELILLKMAEDRGWVSNETLLYLKDRTLPKGYIASRARLKELIFIRFETETRLLVRETRWPVSHYVDLKEIES